MNISGICLTCERITPHISPENESQICFSVKECCVAPGNSSRTATQICWCGPLTDRLQLPRKLRHDANAQSKEPQSALLSAACRGFIFSSKRSVRPQAAYTDSHCLEKKTKRQGSVVDVVLLNRRVTFPSWRRRCRRGCERLSTGCRTTERSAPRYTWSSKHIWIHIWLSLNALGVSCDQLLSSDAGVLTQRGRLSVFFFLSCFIHMFWSFVLLLWKHFCHYVCCQATFYLFIHLNS